MAFNLLKRSTKGSNVPPNVASPSAVYVDRGWNRQVGPGGGWGWGAGPRMFVGPTGAPATITHLGRPGDFVPGDPTASPQPGDLGFPHASRWPGYPASWQTPFYEAESGNPGNFMGGALLENRVAIVFTCVDLISRTMSSMNLVRTQDSSPMTTLPWMDNPEPLVYSSIVDAMKSLINSLLMRGNAFLLATARYNDGTVARWVVLNPDTITWDLDGFGLPRFYLDGRLLPREELLHLKYQAWPGQVLGVGPLEAAWRSIASATAMEKWGTALAITNGIPTAVLSSEAKLTKTQADDLKGSWAEASMSRGILPAILSGGLTYTPLNLKPTEVGLLDMRTFDEQRIASCFGVPLWLVGLPMNSGLTYSTAQATFDYFWRATLRSMSYNISSGLSSWALPRHQWIHFDNDSLVQVDMPARAKAYKDLIDAGVIKPEEARILENMAPSGADTTATLAASTDGGF